MVVACGVDERPVGARRDPILGGTRDEARSGVVFVEVDPPVPNGPSVCTGFLVAPTLVMTARHCVGETAAQDPQSATCADETVMNKALVADRFGPLVPASTVRVTNAVDVIATPLSDLVGAKALHVPSLASDVSCGQDVALVELERPLTGRVLTLRQTPAVVGETFTAVGYGNDGATLTRFVRTSRSGLAVDSVGVTRSSSGRVRTTSDDWTATLGPCQGDSGSPALDPNDRVIGLMQRGPRLCQLPIYVQVAPFAAWVRSVIASRSAGPDDAGAPDAGDPPGLDAGPDGRAVPDAGQLESPDAGSSPSTRPGGAGCSTLGGAPFAAFALLLRRRRP